MHQLSKCNKGMIVMICGHDMWNENHDIGVYLANMVQYVRLL